MFRFILQASVNLLPKSDKNMKITGTSNLSM